MKVLVFLGMLAIFISCFFIFFTFDSMMKSRSMCVIGEKMVCDSMEFNSSMVFAILVIGVFLTVDVLVVYLLFKTWVPGLFMLFS